MKILAIDTSSRYGVIALAENGEPLAELSLRSRETHSARLLPSIDHLLSLLGWTIDQIDAFGVVVGPGSFTGLRVGLATVKGLVWGTDKPVAAIGSLEVLASGLPVSGKLLCPMLDAKKGRVYGGFFKNDGDELMVVRPAEDISVVDLVRNAQEDIVCVGDGARRYANEIRETMGRRATWAPIEFDIPRGHVLARLTQSALTMGAGAPVTELEPRYLRLSEAEMNEDGKRT